MELKENLLKFCKQHVADRRNTLQNQMDVLTESLGSGARSTAGDKHDTERAMVQLEQEKLGKQLLQVDLLKPVLEKIKIGASSEKIALGSWVVTNTASYFIAVSAGAYTTNGSTVFCISPKSPIGQELLGKAVGESIMFRDEEQHILEIY